MTSIAVAGALAARPGNGGGSWVRLSYALGFRRLGFDVRLVEEAAEVSPGALSYARGVAGRFGIPYEIAGPDLEGGDLLVNISGTLTDPDVLRRFDRRVFVDLDPGFTQLWEGRGIGGARLEGHDVYFTVGEGVGRSGCDIPTLGIAWRYTRPPVVLEEWPRVDGERDRFTTVGSWRAPFGPIEPYGLKHHEWRKLLPLPGLVGGRFEAALSIHDADRADRRALEAHGWRLVDPAVAAEPESFRDYVRGSAAEFSVAQGLYVETRSGWFSDRTVRYLASGKPALVQDTGFSESLPVGEGLVAFRTLEEAAAGARSILEDYDRHAKAARAIAEEHFDSDVVLGRMLGEIGVAP